MHRASLPARAALMALVGLGCGAGCGEEFDPQSLLNQIEILALIAEPLDVGLQESTTVTAHVHVPTAEEQPGPDLTWSACPVSLGGRAGFQCIDPRCELPIEPTFSPGELALQCLRAIEDDFDIPDEVRPDAVAGLTASTPPLPVQVRLRAGYREAVTVVNLHFAASPPADPRNRHPVISQIRAPVLTVAEGEAAPLEAVLDPDSLDTYSVDEAGRRVERTEEVLVEWYSTTGRFDPERTDGPIHETSWEATKLEDGEDSVQVWAVARDLRGGQAILGPVTLAIVRD